MLTLFFTIVFIAELIVAGKVISVIKQADGTVCEINSQVSELKPQICKNLEGLSKSVEAATKGVGTINQFLDKKKRDLYISLLKGILGLVVFVLLKKYPHKRWLSVVDLVFTFDSLLKA